MKKTIKFIENRMTTLNNESISKMDMIEAKLVRKNIELRKKITEIEYYSN